MRFSFLLIVVFTAFFLTVLRADTTSSGGGPPPGGTGDVTAAGSIPDNQVVRGDGGAKGIQGSGWLMDDSGHFLAVTDGVSDIGSPDGGTTQNRPAHIYVQDYMQVGDSSLFSAGAFSFPGSILFGTSSELYGFFASGTAGGIGLLMGAIFNTAADDFSAFFVPLAAGVLPGHNREDLFVHERSPGDPGGARRIRFIVDGADAGGIELAVQKHADEPTLNGGALLGVRQVEFFEQSSTPSTRFTTHTGLHAKTDGDIYKHDSLGVAVRMLDADLAGTLAVAQWNASADIEANLVVSIAELEFAADGATENHQSALDDTFRISNNLSEVLSKPTARSNLGLGITDSVSFGTIFASGNFGSAAVVTDVFGNFVEDPAGTTDAQIGFLNTLTGNVQTQIDAGLIAANNLSDVLSAATSRTNLGLGTSDSVFFGSIGVTGNAGNLAAVSNGSGEYIESPDGTSDAQIGFLNTLSSNAQTQMTTNASNATGSIDAHSDVDVTTTPPISNDRLEFDGSNWVPVAGAGVAAHAATHIDGGSDPIDADQLEVSFVPNIYTRDSTIPEANTDDDLSAHLAGIDNLLGILAEDAQKGEVTTTDGTPVLVTDAAVTVAEGETIFYEQKCSAVRTDATAGDKGYGSYFIGTFRREVGGSVVAIGSITTIHEKMDTPQAYSTDVDLTGNVISPEVTGASSQTVPWECATFVNRVS